MVVLDWFRRAASSVTVLLALVVLAACGGGDGASNPAAAELTVMLGQALSADDVARIRVQVQGPGITTEVATDLVRSGSTWNGTLRDIPAGADRIFTATAYDASSTVIYQGQAGPVTIQPGRVAAVVVRLQQVNTPPPFDNEAPIIDSLTVSANEAEPGGSLSLSAAAHDNNPADTLTYAWSATGGTFSASTSASTEWTAPATEGTQHLTLEVRDSRNATATISIDLVVRGNGPMGRAAVTVSVNTWPEVSAMMGAPSVLAVGTTTQLAISASDPDGDALNYFWVSSCEGSFSDFISRTPAFTLSAVPVDARCVFTAYVSDPRGGFQSGNLTLHVGSGPQIHMQRVPVVDSVSQTAEWAASGQSVTLGLSAHDPDGTALTFSWAASQGTVAATRSSGGSAEADWLAPGCFDSPAEVTATVTDAGGSTTRVTFTILSAGGPICDERTVVGRRYTHFVQADGSITVRPEDLSNVYMAAWVPTADGSYVFRGAITLSDGTFIIPEVDSTPYLLQYSSNAGTTYYWLDTRTPDLSAAAAGRPDVVLEPDGTLFNLDLSGLEPWYATDDLQVSAFGAGITYYGQSQCASPALGIMLGSTAFTGTTGYNTSLTRCSNRPGRIDLSRGDEVFVGQLVSRPGVGGMSSIQEARRGFLISSGNPGGSVVSGGGAVSLSGTLAPLLPTSSRAVNIHASEFEAMLLAAHPRATLLGTQQLTVGALPGFMQLGTYAGWFDLARGTNSTPGQPLVAPVLEFADPFPAAWNRFAANFAEGSVSYSVPLSGGGSSTAAAFRFTVYAHGPFQGGQPLQLGPRVGLPGNLRINGQAAVNDGLQGVGLTPLVTWDAPSVGTATSYSVRLYRLFVGTGNTTRRALVGTLITTDTQLRLPPELLSAGQHYYLHVQANMRVGGDTSRLNFDAPWVNTASVFSGRFQP